PLPISSTAWRSPNQRSSTARIGSRLRSQAGEKGRMARPCYARPARAPPRPDDHPGGRCRLTTRSRRAKTGAACSGRLPARPRFRAVCVSWGVQVAHLHRQRPPRRSPAMSSARRARCAAVAFALLATSPFTIASETVAEGSMRLEQADWRVADAMAWQDGEELEIVFSDKPFDRAAMTADGELDVFDFMRHGGNRFAINLDADGPTMCVDMTTQAGDTVWSGSNCNSEFPPAIRITTRS